MQDRVLLLSAALVVMSLPRSVVAQVEDPGALFPAKTLVYMQLNQPAEFLIQRAAQWVVESKYQSD